MEINEITAIVKSKYCIDVDSVEKSEESTDGNVYIISDKTAKKFVIKIYDNEKHAECMTKLYTYLEKRKINAPYIINNSDGYSITKYEDKYIVCYSFVKGEKLKYVDFSKERIENVAKYLRKLHKIKVNTFQLSEVPFKINSNRQSVLHFDITKHNIFANDDKICFIDFDDAKFGPSVCDVAIAITNLFISKATGIDEVGMELFINEYYGGDEELKEKELPIIKKAALEWLQSIIDNPNFDTSTRAGLQNKMSILGAVKIGTEQ